MIKDHEKFRIVDENKINNFLIEVNWNPKDEKTNHCRMLRIIFPDGKECVIKKEHLAAILFAIGNEEEQKKLIPQKLSRVRWYETVLSVKATKDIRKGENITFPIKLTMPSEEEEIIGSLRSESARKALEGKSRQV